MPVYSAVLGANCVSRPGALAVSRDGVAVFSVLTDAGFPLQNPVSTVPFGAVARLSADGSSLLFFTFVDTASAVTGRHRVYAGFTAYHGDGHPGVVALRPASD